ncbi:MAG: dihydrodipicolinate synthase family protein [bacterium]|nr:dihydrodipicolinate synthase family protein [bacterium]
MKNNNNITGLFVPIITPFHRGKFDEISMKKLIKSLDSSVDGYIPCLSSGEGKKLSVKEWENVINTVSASTKNPVFAGILRSDEKEIFTLIKKANSLPCIGIVIPTLYKTDEKNLQYIKQATEFSKKQIILYNTEEHPLKSLETIQALDSLSKIVAMKDSSMNLSFFKKLIALKKQDKLSMKIFQGMEHLLLQSIGCDGYVISLLNTESKLCKSMFQKQDKATNNKIISKFWEQNLGGNWHISLKAILHERGVIRSAEEINQPIKI